MDSIFCPSGNRSFFPLFGKERTIDTPHFLSVGKAVFHFLNTFVPALSHFSDARPEKTAYHPPFLSCFSRGIWQECSHPKGGAVWFCPHRTGLKPLPTSKASVDSSKGIHTRLATHHCILSAFWRENGRDTCFSFHCLQRYMSLHFQCKGMKLWTYAQGHANSALRKFSKLLVS